ncbi:MAG: amidohydrolase family protein [bacterium]
MHKDLFVIEGIVANTGERKSIEINTETGLISKISEPNNKADVTLENELIFPGFIDLHVHAREDTSHTQDYKEDFITANEAAINGGVVAFAEMPNNPIPPIDDESYEAKNKLTKKSKVEILLYAGIGPHTSPLNKKVPYKVFMGPSVGELFFNTQKELEEVIKNYEGESVSFHCEDPEILEKNKNERTHEKRRPPTAEISAVDFALGLIEKYHLSGKICHCSTLEGVNKIIDAKARGVSVVVEVTPHHLYFDETILREERKMFQVNPPIRQSKENRLGLIKLLKEGKIDFLATDHAPHTIEEKERGMSGLTHLDTYGPFVSWLMKEHDFTPQEIVRVCSENPGNFINNFSEKKPARTTDFVQSGGYGKIEEGYVGSLTILDMNKPVKITKEILKTKCGWSPFEGITFDGSVVMTIIKGKILKNEIK